MEKGSCTQAAYDDAEGAERVTLDGLNLLLMQSLVKHTNQPLTPEILSQEVWKRDHVSLDTIAKRVSLLRTALLPLSGGEQIIRTLPNRGYQLVGGAKPINDQTVKDAVLNQPAAQGPQTPPSKSMPYGARIWAAIVIIIGVGLIYYINKQDSPPTLKDPGTGLELVAPGN